MGSFRKLAYWLGPNPLEPLRDMEPHVRSRLVRQWLSWALFAACLVMIGSTAVLAVRTPAGITVTELVEDPRAIRRLAGALVAQENEIDLICQIRYRAQSPAPNSDPSVMVLVCRHQDPSLPSSPDPP